MIEDLFNTKRILDNYGMTDYCQRSLPLLKELKVIPVLRALVATVLEGSPLRTETVEQVQKAILDAHLPLFKLHHM